MEMTRALIQFLFMMAMSMLLADSPKDHAIGKNGIKTNLTTNADLKPLVL